MNVRRGAFGSIERSVRGFQRPITRERDLLIDGSVNYVLCLCLYERLSHPSTPRGAQEITDTGHNENCQCGKELRVKNNLYFISIP